MQVLGAIFLASCSLYMQHAPLFLREREEEDRGGGRRVVKTYACSPPKIKRKIRVLDDVTVHISVVEGVTFSRRNKKPKQQEKNRRRDCACFGVGGFKLSGG